MNPVVTRTLTILALLSALLAGAARPAQAQTGSVLYSFTGQPDAGIPSAGLIIDAKGNLYGTTYGGGVYGEGAIFEVTPEGAETVLYSFTGGADGSGPAAGLNRAGGKLYGTTIVGGANFFGAAFEVTRRGQETVLASFSDSDGGGYPEGGLVRDKQGNLYGTLSGYNDGYGTGAVFEISSTGTLTILYQFTGGRDGLCPYGNLVLDKNGNVYGTTYRGGAAGYGTVFEVNPDGKETVLYSFTGGTDGSFPAAGLLRDAKGNLYGTTTGGGNGHGTVFEVTASGKEIVLHSFNDSDGYYPIASLVRDKKGNLYGTTEFGGSHGNGTVFELTKAGSQTVLYNFPGGAGGGWPVSSLVFDKQGNLYGTTSEGGSSNCLDGCGVVFKITPASGVK